MKKSISTAAIKRIVTAQRMPGWRNWKLNFSKAQAREEGLTPKQIEEAHETFGHYYGTTDKAGMVEILSALLNS